jgi:5,10-methylenetetrahydromethanopterin reductase
MARRRTLMKFGLCFAMSEREPITRVEKLASLAEDYGFDCIWIIDSPIVAKDVYVTLTLAAKATATLKVGTGVTVIQLRHPVATASAAATIAELSGDRMMLGIGAGDSAVKPMGFEPVRVNDLGQYISAIQSLLRGETTPLPPTMNNSVKIAAAPRVVPVFVAAGLPRMLRMSGSTADGVIVMGPNRAEWMKWQIDEVLEGAGDVGRSREDLQIDLWTTISVDDDVSKAASDVKPWVAAQARSLGGRLSEVPWLEGHRDEVQKASTAYDFRHHLSRGAPHGGMVSDALAREVAIAGPVDECIDRLRAIASLGPDRITMTLLPGDRERRLRVFGEEILPAVQDVAKAPS